jgi:hypothetical protein
VSFSGEEKLIQSSAVKLRDTMKMTKKKPGILWGIIKAIIKAEIDMKY